MRRRKHPLLVAMHASCATLHARHDIVPMSLASLLASCAHRSAMGAPALRMGCVCVCAGGGGGRHYRECSLAHRFAHFFGLDDAFGDIVALKELEPSQVCVRGQLAVAFLQLAACVCMCMYTYITCSISFSFSLSLYRYIYLRSFNLWPGYTCTC